MAVLDVANGGVGMRAPGQTHGAGVARGGVETQARGKTQEEGVAREGETRVRRQTIIAPRPATTSPGKSPRRKVT
ncbi:MAG: hypothetical protein ABSG53_27585 [Thermoguttaceae bacterium]